MEWLPEEKAINAIFNWGQLVAAQPDDVRAQREIVLSVFPKHTTTHCLVGNRTGEPSTVRLPTEMSTNSAISAGYKNH